MKLDLGQTFRFPATLSLQLQAMGDHEAEQVLDTERRAAMHSGEQVWLRSQQKAILEQYRKFNVKRKRECPKYEY